MSWHVIWHADLASVASRLRTALTAIDDPEDTVVILPEYTAIEAAMVGPQGVWSAADWVTKGADCFDAYCGIVAGLASDTGAHILGGSGFAHKDRGIVNRAMLAAPEGACGFVEKQVPTLYERALGIAGGPPSPVFETRLGRIGVLICYDIEFPLLARRQIDAGADVILVPSCTDTPHGATRVEIGARARALEGQIVVAVAPTSGSDALCPIVDVNFGTASVFCPPDTGLPADGVLARGPLDSVGTAGFDMAQLPRASLAHGGEIATRAHWSETQSDTRAVNVVSLR